MKSQHHTALENKNFHKAIEVNASAPEAMKKISQVNLWWAKNFSGRAEKLNDKFTVRFGDTFVDFVISELVPNKKVVWKVSDCNLHWIEAKRNGITRKLFLKFHLKITRPRSISLTWG